MRRLVIGSVRVATFDADYCRSADEFRRMYPTLYPSKHANRLLPHYDECWLEYDRGDASFGPDMVALVDEIREFAVKGDLLPIDTFVINTSDTIDRETMYDALGSWYHVVRAR